MRTPRLRQLLLTTICLWSITLVVRTHAAEPQSLLPHPARVMYGYSDPDQVRWSGFWLERQQWVDAWEQSFQHFNVITGKTQDAALVKRLRMRGVVFAYHVQNLHDKHHPTAAYLVKEWSKPFENQLGGALPQGFDAISIDEIHSDPDGSPAAKMTIDALRELRQRYPRKGIIVWSVNRVGLSGSQGAYGKRYAKDVTFDEQLRAIEDCCDLYILECYHREANPHFKLFTEGGHNLQTRFPRLFQKTVFGLGIAQSPNHNYDDRADVDFAEFLERQFQLIQQDPVLKQMPGIAFWPFYRAQPELHPKINALVDKYYPPTPKK